MRNQINQTNQTNQTNQNYIQNGGKGKIIPAYTETLNSPYKIESQKQIDKQNFTEKKVNFEQNNYDPLTQTPFSTSNPTNNPTSNFTKSKSDTKTYQENKKPPTMVESKMAEIPIQPIALSTPFFPPQFQSYMSNFMKNFYTPFVYKDYHINIGGPNADHIQASMVYEDALPPPNVFSSYKTVKERNALCQYIRGTFIQIQEGELIDFKGGPNSLNSRLKLIELNPYNTNYFSSNPYKGLPENMLIYKSCYPIIYDKKEATVQCQKSSIGINMRVYKLSKDEYNIIKPELPEPVKPKAGSVFDPNNIDEILGILTSNQKEEFLKKINLIMKKEEKFNNIEDVIKKLISHDKLEFIKKIKKIINEEREKKQQTNMDINYIDFLKKITGYENTDFIETINPLVNKNKTHFDIWREVEYYEFIRNIINKEFISPNFIESYCYFMNTDAKLDFGKNTMKFNKITQEIIKYSDKTLILLTESPNNNIWTWASNLYTKEKNIQKQIYSGYKQDFIWESIIMQILIVFYIMDKLNFTFNQMSLQKNFFIKDINVYSDVFNYWRYKINNIDYYVPNYGHLLMFDSDYHDLTIKGPKIIAKMFGDDIGLIHSTIKSNALECLDPNNFGQEFINQGGVKPSTDIIKLMTIICDNIRNDDSFETIIQNNFLKYIHNRVGTQLRKGEVEYVRKYDTRPFRKGELIIHEISFDTFEILVFIDNLNEFEYVCAGKDSKDFILKNIPKDLIFHYSEYETIRQDLKPGEPSLNLDYIIETYNL